MSFVLCLSDSWRCQPPKVPRAGPTFYPQCPLVSGWELNELKTTTTKVQVHRGVKLSRLGILLRVDFRSASWYKNNGN